MNKNNNVSLSKKDLHCSIGDSMHDVLGKLINAYQAIEISIWDFKEKSEKSLKVLELAIKQKKNSYEGYKKLKHKLAQVGIYYVDHFCNKFNFNKSGVRKYLGITRGTFERSRAVIESQGG